MRMWRAAASDMVHSAPCSSSASQSSPTHRPIAETPHQPLSFPFLKRPFGPKEGRCVLVFSAKLVCFLDRRGCTTMKPPTLFCAQFYVICAQKLCVKRRWSLHFHCRTLPVVDLPRAHARVISVAWPLLKCRAASDIHTYIHTYILNGSSALQSFELSDVLKTN